MKPTGVYRIITLPDYKDMALDELLVFAPGSYKYGYDYGLEVNRYLWQLL
jgi:hypothetical protein